MTTDLVPLTSHGGDLAHVGCGCGGTSRHDHQRGGLPELTRNLFFPRKLMEVHHWRAEQAYHRTARELVTRLGLGSGVLCGLEVRLTSEGMVAIGAGVGVDGHGRVVVVPHRLEVDPARPTDACGRPAVEPLEEGTVTVALCYHECGTDPVCMPPEGCGDEPRLVPSMVREAYAVSVTVGATTRVGLPDGLCEQVFGCEECEAAANDPTSESEFPEDAEGRRVLLDRLHPRRCACEETCIPLATVTLGAERALDTGVRTVIRTNRELLDLILCLADRVDECCNKLPPAVPPRVTAVWPWPDVEGGASLESFVESGRLELAVDRDLAEQGLDDPDSWLGVWLLDPRRVTRLELTRAAGALTHVAVPASGDGAAYDVDVRRARPTSRSMVVVMMRSTAPGPIRAAGTDRLALDPDLRGTGLTDDDRDLLWAMAPGSRDTTLGTVIADAGIPTPLPGLPSGDGTAGGDLHVVLRAPTKVVPPPRLLTVGPEGGSELSEKDQVAWKVFLGEPSLELTVSRALAATAVDNPKGWLRLWRGTADGDLLFSVDELPLAPGVATDLPDGSVHYRFPFKPPDWFPRNVLVVQLRSTPPVVGESPVGRDDPAVLLDADFSGTSLGSQDLFRLWSGDLFPNGLPVPPVSSTAGQVLFDGTEGGLAHWAFTVVRP